jgi:hypothetical protein
VRMLVLIALCLGAAGAAIAPAAAAPARRIAVLAADEGAAPTAAAIARGLGRKVTVVPVETTDPTVAARAHDLPAVVRVSSRAARGGLTIEVALLQGMDGAVLARYQVTGPRRTVARIASRKAWRRLRTALAAAQPPAPLAAAAAAAAPVAPEVVPAEVAAAAPVVPVAARRPGARAVPTAPGAVAARAPAPADAPWLEVAVGGGPFARRFRYHDELRGELRSYDLMATVAAMSLLARPPGAVGRWLAVVGAAELAVGVSGSRTRSGTAYDTAASEWSAGARVEAPWRAVRPRLEARYGEQRFHLDGASDVAVVPDVTYRWLGAAAGIRIAATRGLGIDARFGYRHLLATGDLADAMWFPRVEGAAIEAGIGATLRVHRAITVEAGVDLRRYFFTLNPVREDVRVAGGALDQYLTVRAGAAIELR